MEDRFLLQADLHYAISKHNNWHTNDVTTTQAVCDELVFWLNYMSKETLDEVVKTMQECIERVKATHAKEVEKKKNEALKSIE